MNGPEFDHKSSGFWGLLSGLVFLLNSIFKYLIAKAATKKAESNLAEVLTKKETIMSEIKLGTKETMDALMALNALGLFIIGRTKDGVDLQDGVALVEKLLIDAEFKKLLSDAISGIDQVPAELKDLDIGEAFTLGQYEFAQIQAIIAALK